MKRKYTIAAVTTAAAAAGGLALLAALPANAAAANTVAAWAWTAPIVTSLGNTQISDPQPNSPFYNDWSNYTLKGTAFSTPWADADLHPGAPASVKAAGTPSYTESGDAAYCWNGSPTAATKPALPPQSSQTTGATRLGQVTFDPSTGLGAGTTAAHDDAVMSYVFKNNASFQKTITVDLGVCNALGLTGEAYIPGADASTGVAKISDPAFNNQADPNDESTKLVHFAGNGTTLPAGAEISVKPIGNSQIQITYVGFPAAAQAQPGHTSFTVLARTASGDQVGFEVTNNWSVKTPVIVDTPPSERPPVVSG